MFGPLQPINDECPLPRREACRLANAANVSFPPYFLSAAFYACEVGDTALDLSAACVSVGVILFAA